MDVFYQWSLWHSRCLLMLRSQLLNGWAITRILKITCPSFLKIVGLVTNVSDLLFKYPWFTGSLVALDAYGCCYTSSSQSGCHLPAVAQFGAIPACHWTATAQPPNVLGRQLLEKNRPFVVKFQLFLKKICGCLQNLLNNLNLGCRALVCWNSWL